MCNGKCDVQISKRSASIDVPEEHFACGDDTTASLSFRVQEADTEFLDEIYYVGEVVLTEMMK